MNTNKKFRNMVDDPYLLHHSKGIPAHNFCGACGLAASGDSEPPAGDPAATTAKVQNIKTWHYAKTALALVGIFVIGKYLWNKYGK